MHESSIPPAFALPVQSGLLSAPSPASSAGHPDPIVDQQERRMVAGSAGPRAHNVTVRLDHAHRAATTFGFGGAFSAIGGAFRSALDWLFGNDRFHAAAGSWHATVPLGRQPDTAATSDACAMTPPPSAPYLDLPLELLRHIADAVGNCRDIARWASVDRCTRALFQQHRSLLMAPSLLQAEAQAVRTLADVRALVAEVSRARLNSSDAVQVLVEASSKLRRLPMPDDGRLEAVTCLWRALLTLPDAVLAASSGGLPMIGRFVTNAIGAFNDSGLAPPWLIEALFRGVEGRSARLADLTLGAMEGCIDGWSPAFECQCIFDRPVHHAAGTASLSHLAALL